MTSSGVGMEAAHTTTSAAAGGQLITAPSRPPGSLVVARRDLLAPLIRRVSHQEFVHPLAATPSSYSCDGPQVGPRVRAVIATLLVRRCCRRFSDRMVPEVYQVFGAGMAAGEFINDAAIAAGSYRKQGTCWLAAVGGVRPRRGRNLKGRCLTLAQREEIALGRAGGDSIRAIAAIIGRSPSTVSRELGRNADGLGRYRATSAHALAYHRASRPKPAKLVTNLGLRGMVEKDLEKKYSPEQIAGRLKVDFPDQPEMQVSTETIYQSLYVQSRGALKQELTRCLRTGRAVRRPSRKVGQRKNRIPNMINIAERPAEADDRAVPGHWEGDLIIGRKNLSAIGPLVERTTNYTMLLHLPDGYTPELVRDALAAKIKTLPEVLRASLTWDQGPEMGKWKQVS